MISTPFELRRPPLPYRPQDYLSGVTKLPPWLRYKKQQFYAYALDSTATTPIQQNNTITLEGTSFFLLEAINLFGYNISGDAQAVLKIAFSDTSKGINWSPNSIAFPNIAGRGDTTKYLSHPTLLKPSSSILYSISNTPSSVPVYGALIGRKIFGLTPDEAAFLMRRIWYQYDVLVGPLSPGQYNYFPLQTANDSDFYLWKIYSAEGIQYSAAYAPLTVAVRDITTNKNIFSQQAELSLVAGQQYGLSTTNMNGTNTGKGFCFPIPRRIRKNSTIVIDITNTDTNGSDPVFGPANFTLEGVRVFAS